MIEETTRELIRILREEFFPEDLTETDENKKHVNLSAGSITQLSTLPAIILYGPVLTEKKRLMRDPERITEIDEEAGQAKREVPPRWYDLRFDVNISCESNIELLRLFEKLSRLNQRKSLLMNKYLWRIETPLQNTTNPNISQIYQGRAGIIIYDVEIYSEIFDVYPLIKKVDVEINQDKIEVQA